MTSSWIRHLVLLCGVYGTLGARIINCNNNNKVEIFEDSPAPVTCGDITSIADVVWRRGDGINIGDCGADGTCRDDLYTDYRLSRSPQSRESQLTLVPDYRRHAGVTVTCEDKMKPPRTTCTLVIRRHSVVSECQVTNNTVDWTVSGSCRVQAYSSDNNYSCTWRQNDQTFGGFDASRELCSFTQPLPQAGGLYTYSISLSPPPATTTFSQELRLVEPGDVTTTCPHWVVSGRDLSCTCQTTNTPSPPATVRWEGRDSEKLVKTNVQREDNGTQFTCHVTLAGRVYTSITYTLLVTWAGNITVVSTTDSQSSAPAVVGPVVGTIAAVVVTAVIVILLVILIRRRRQKLTKTPEKSTKSPPCKDSEFEEHVNVVYDSSDNAGSKGRSGQNYRSRGQGTDSEASRWNKQGVTAQYQDNPSEGYYSEIRDIVTGKTYPQPHQRLSMNPYSN